MSTKEAAYLTVEKLVIRFNEQIGSYKRSDYNETLVRRDFIDPFFKALGWDIDNSQGYAEAYREVIHEDKIKIGKATKAPDYSFRLPGGKRLFFVEAKKPSILVKSDVLPAYQLRRYAWSAGLSISILTDFEELAIYDCRKKPKVDDKASVSRIRYLTYAEYLAQFDFLWETFSKEKVLKGAFDKFVAGDTNKKGTTTFDKDFLILLNEWRKELALNIALRNSILNEEELNFSVQQIIDRIIFLRIAEDRGVEDYGKLIATLKGDNYYNNLFSLFKEADKKYNSGIFDFKKDKISSTIHVDNKLIKSILNGLYYPESPYEFSVVNVEILGNVYEQFLGQQIKLSGSHKAIVDEKPEVRKAGGVYYTPQYIVDYIVGETLQPLVSGKTPEQMAKLRIVDPACGSGSFLLGAYKFLLDWYREYYKPEYTRLSQIAVNGTEYNLRQRNEAVRERSKLPLTPDGNLTTTLKKSILLNNIYGVDIDVQAVEVTKLSLLLKCMEAETQNTIAAEIRFGERILPTLDDNIKCGNSLVDTDFYDTQLNLEPDLEKAIRPFNWRMSFPAIHKQKGFDAVIGNPPYIRIQSIVENSPQQAKYFSDKYASAGKGNYDIYVIFIEKALSLINKSGRIGYILPHKFFTAQYGESIRDLLSLKKSIERLVHFGHQQIFDNATTYTSILILSNDATRSSFEFIKVDDLEAWKSQAEIKSSTVEYSSLTKTEWNFLEGKAYDLYSKLKTVNETLENVADRIFQGIKTSADKIYIVHKIKDRGEDIEIWCPQNERHYIVEKALFHKLIKGGDSLGFAFKESDLLLLFPYEQSELIPESALKKRYPLTYNYLKEHKPYLENREDGRMKTSKWYGYIYPKALDVIGMPKIFTPDISPYAKYSIDQLGDTFFTGGVSGGYGITLKDGMSYSYLLGLLNSRLLDWYLKQISTPMRGGWYSFEAKYIKQLPIHRPTEHQKGIEQKICALVETLIILKREENNCTLPDKREQISQRIEHANTTLNSLVFELYDLDDDEIGLVASVEVEQTQGSKDLS